MKRTIRLKIDEKEIAVTAERDGDTLHLDHDGEQFDVQIVPEERSVVKPKPKPVPRPTSVPSTTTSAPPVQAAPTVTGAGVIAAPMTGVVKEVVAPVGTEVNADQPVIIMEAMKMDVEVSAPTGGVVKEVFVQPGQNVRERAPLMRIE